MEADAKVTCTRLCNPINNNVTIDESVKVMQSPWKCNVSRTIAYINKKTPKACLSLFHTKIEILFRIGQF